MIESLRLRRTGSFHVSHCSGSRDNQCGSFGTSTFEYRVTIETDPVVDAQGFIIDSITVRDYFTSTFGVVEELPSCELMCMQACRALAALVGNTCRRIEVEIGVDALAGLSAVWVRPRTIEEAYLQADELVCPKCIQRAGLPPAGTQLT